MPGTNYPYTSLDYSQVIRQSFDEVNDRLRVDASVSVVLGTVEVVIDAANDSIKIGDGDGDFLDINPDGSINVNIVSTGVTRNTINTYNEITSIASGSETTISTYTAPVGKTTYITRIEATGTNIAQYQVYKNLSVISKFYTNFGSDLSTTFEYMTGIGDFPGLKVNVGDVITIKVLHSRAAAGDFAARIQSIEVG